MTKMRNPNPDDILSACFDNEASAEEQQTAKHLLAESAAAREEMEELEQLSKLLKSLPLTPAPPELAHSVMQQAEPEMLLPASSTTPPATASRWFNWKIAVGTLAAALLATLLLPRLTLTRQAGELELASGNASTARDMANAETSDFVDNMSGPESSEELVENAPASAPMSKSMQPPQFGSDSNSLPVTEADSKSENGERELADDSAALPVHQPVYLQEIDWSQVHVGDMKRVLDRAGESVAVIEVTVVDIQQAVNMTQVFLSTNAIASLDDNVATPEVTLDSKDSTSAESTKLPASFVLYVEADENSLKNALMSMSENEMLSNNTFFAGRSVNPRKLDVIASNSISSNGLSGSESVESDFASKTEKQNSFEYNNLADTILPVQQSRSFGRFRQFSGQEAGSQRRAAPEGKERSSALSKPQVKPDSRLRADADRDVSPNSELQTGPVIAPLPDDDSFQMLLVAPSLAQLKEATIEPHSGTSPNEIEPTFDRIVVSRNRLKKSNLPKNMARPSKPPLAVAESSRPEPMSKDDLQPGDKPQTVSSSQVRVLFVFRKTDEMLPAETELP